MFRAVNRWSPAIRRNIAKAASATIRRLGMLFCALTYIGGGVHGRLQTESNLFSTSPSN